MRYTAFDTHARARACACRACVVRVSCVLVLKGGRVPGGRVPRASQCSYDLAVYVSPVRDARESSVRV